MNKYIIGGVAVGLITTIGIEGVEEGLEPVAAAGEVHVPHEDHGPFARRASFEFLTSGVSSVTANQLLYELPDGSDADDAVILVRFPAARRAR